MLDGILQILDRRRNAPIGDHGTVVSIVSWILLAIMIFLLITRFAMKMALGKKGRRFSLDDVFILLAALFSIGQTAAVSVEALHVLGQHLSDLSPKQIRIFQKAEYASCMLYIANLGCARISVCLLINYLLPGKVAKRSTLGFAVLTALWTVSGVLITAFPCHLPQPWNFYNNKCIDLDKYVNYVGITNIVVELLLIMIPLIVWNIRLDVGRRVSVSCIFLSRLSVVATVAAQLAVFNHNDKTPDFSYVYWRTVICVQIAQNLSVITACFPCLHPFILSRLSADTNKDGQGTKPSDVGRFSISNCFKRDTWNFDSMSSHASTSPIREEKDTDYCRPLATYGLDQSSANLSSQHFTRIPANVAQPIRNDAPNETFFNRSVDYPRSRPGTSSSQKELPAPPPKSLCQVGVLPVIEWDTDSSSDHESDRSSPSRKRDSEYIFNREKVISVPDGGKIYESMEYWRKYPPPPPSPGQPPAV